MDSIIVVDEFVFLQNEVIGHVCSLCHPGKSHSFFLLRDMNRERGNIILR